MRHYQISFEENSYRPQMKFYKVVPRTTLLYVSETWVTTKRDMTRLEAAEMRFLRSVKRYTRLDKITSEIISKELEIPRTQHVRTKCKQIWISNLERIDNNRLPNTPSTSNAEDEAIVYAPGKDGDESMPDQVKRPNPLRKMIMMMMMMMMMILIINLVSHFINI